MFQWRRQLGGKAFQLAVPSLFSKLKLLVNLFWSKPLLTEAELSPAYVLLGSIWERWRNNLISYEIKLSDLQKVAGHRFKANRVSVKQINFNNNKQHQLHLQTRDVCAVYSKTRVCAGRLVKQMCGLKNTSDKNVSIVSRSLRRTYFQNEKQNRKLYWRKNLS